VAKAETLTARVTRIEQLHSDLAEKMAALVDSQIRTESQLAEMRKESLELERHMDARIGKLVIAIGEFIRVNGKS
jgi:hypothetical protein